MGSAEASGAHVQTEYICSVCAGTHTALDVSSLCPSQTVMLQPLPSLPCCGTAPQGRWGLCGFPACIRGELLWSSPITDLGCFWGTPWVNTSNSHPYPKQSVLGLGHLCISWSCLLLSCDHPGSSAITWHEWVGPQHSPGLEWRTCSIVVENAVATK